MIYPCPSRESVITYRRIGVGVNPFGIRTFFLSKRERKKRERKEKKERELFGRISAVSEGKWLLPAFRGRKDERKGLLDPFGYRDRVCVATAEGGGGIRGENVNKRAKERERKSFLAAPSPSCLVFRHLCSRLDETGVGGWRGRGRGAAGGAEGKGAG